MADPIDTTIKAEWTNADALDLQPTCNQLATDSISRQEAIETVHKVIYDFFDMVDDDDESPITDKDKQLLSVNKAISTRLKALPSAQHTTCKYWDTESDFCALYRPSAQPEIVVCEYCRWGREACGNIECFADANVPPEYHGYDWFCPNGERRTDGM